MIKYLLFTLLVVQDLMAYSESPYKVVHQTDKYEIRFYEERLVVQTQYTNPVSYTHLTLPTSQLV